MWTGKKNVLRILLPLYTGGKEKARLTVYTLWIISLCLKCYNVSRAVMRGFFYSDLKISSLLLQSWNIVLPPSNAFRVQLEHLKAKKPRLRQTY